MDIECFEDFSGEGHRSFRGSMSICFCGCLECLWEREHPDWVAFWCICGLINKPSLGLNFSVRAKRMKCTSRFPILFPLVNCLALMSYRSRSSLVARNSPLRGPTARNKECVESNRFEGPTMVESFVIELSDSEGLSANFGDATDEDFVAFLREVIHLRPNNVGPSDHIGFFDNPRTDSGEGFECAYHGDRVE